MGIGMRFWKKKLQRSSVFPSSW